MRTFYSNHSKAVSQYLSGFGRWWTLTLFGLLGVVGMALATPRTMIWPTGLGDFLIKRVPAEETFGLDSSDSLASSRRGGFFRTTEAPMPERVRGYLAEGPARPLLWKQSSPIATTTLVLRFEGNRMTQSDMANVPALEEPKAQTMDSLPLETLTMTEQLNTRAMTSTPSEPPPDPTEEELALPEERSRSILDQKFVNWVTRRMDDTKVEIPFQLPSGNSAEEPVAPTERVRVRYRVEP